MLKIVYAQLVVLFALPIVIAIIIEGIHVFNEFIYLPLIASSLAVLQILRYNHIILIRIKYFLPIFLIGFYAINVFLLQTDVIIGWLALVAVLMLIPLYKKEVYYLNKENDHG